MFSLLSILLLLSLQGTHWTQSHENTRHVNPSRAVAMTSDSDRIGDACFRVFGLMEAGNFFEKLRRINTADGPRFRKDNSDVTSFPASLDITVLIHAIRCDGDTRNPVTSTLDPALVSTFQLKAEWKKPDGALRQGYAEFYEPSLTKVTQTQLEWRFKGKVNSDKVSIADRLVLSLLTDKGDRIARISGGASDQ